MRLRINKVADIKILHSALLKTLSKAEKRRLGIEDELTQDFTTSLLAGRFNAIIKTKQEAFEKSLEALKAPHMLRNLGLTASAQTGTEMMAATEEAKPLPKRLRMVALDLKREYAALKSETKASLALKPMSYAKPVLDQLGLIILGLGSVLAKKASVSPNERKKAELLVRLAERKLNGCQAVLTNMSVAPTRGEAIKKARKFIDGSKKLALLANHVNKVL